MSAYLLLGPSPIMYSTTLQEDRKHHQWSKIERELKMQDEEIHDLIDEVQPKFKLVSIISRHTAGLKITAGQRPAKFTI